MYAVADTNRLVADKVITLEQAHAIESRARETMVALAINTLLFLGIVAASGGLIFWLASPVAVAISGVLAFIAGLLILLQGQSTFRMFGHASALIGAGLLLGGTSLQLIDKHQVIAGPAMAVVGALIALVAVALLYRLAASTRVLLGAIVLMGLAMHIFGVGFLLKENAVTGLPLSLFYLYAAGLIAGAGWYIDVRTVTALAIVPFAQALDTSTFYFHALYVFSSPEPTLSILQMSLLIAACLWLSKQEPERTARHARVLAGISFIVANLCALVGSLWGDVVGETLWGPGRWWDYGTGMSWQDYEAARTKFEETALVLSANVYSVLWAAALIVILLWAAHRSHRGLFNTTLTFGAIHAYTQLFESFADEPLAYVIGGLAAIPLAWGMWKFNSVLAAKHANERAASS